MKNVSEVLSFCMDLGPLLQEQYKNFLIFQSRKERLDESYSLHRFLADFRDLVSWINDMKAIISADELAKDVAGAEALLERHQEHRGEIDAREDSFAATIEAGQQLLQREHYAADEVKEKLSMLTSDKNSLLRKYQIGFMRGFMIALCH